MIYYELTIEHEKYTHNFVIREKQTKTRGNSISRVVMEFYVDCYDDTPDTYKLYNEGGYCIIGELRKDTFCVIKEVKVIDVND